jgi:hypothetical protein
MYTLFFESHAIRHYVFNNLQQLCRISATDGTSDLTQTLVVLDGVSGTLPGSSIAQFTAGAACRLVGYAVSP